MFAKATAAVCAVFVFSSCNTLMESSDPYRPAPTYTATKNQKGETIYVSERPKPTYVSPPVIYPVQPTYPIPVTNPNVGLYPTPGATITPSQPTYYPGNQNEGSSTVNLDPSSKNDFNAFLEMSRTKGNTHLGFHFGGSSNEILYGRLGGSMFFSGDELFMGLDVSGRAYIPTKKVQPFAGAGLYWGDTKKCTDGYSNGQPVERCEKKFLGAGYVELGLEVMNISVFWRDYNITRAGLSVPTESFWGIGLRF